MMNTESPANQRARNHVAKFVWIVVCIGVFALGIGIGRATYDANGAAPKTAAVKVKNKDAVGKLPKDLDFRQFWTVWSAIQEKYVKRPVDESALYYGALQGLVASLNDPYSVYFTPQIATQFQEELQGSFTGIGAEVGAKENRVVIVAPLPDSPAERAGVLAGDSILSINDVSTNGLTVDEAVKQIRGPEGTNVVLHLERVGTKEPIKITIKRAKIELKSVTAQIIPDNILLLKVTTFNEQTEPQFEAAVKLAQEKKVKGIILDLRNNPGGFFEQSIDFASEWLDNGKVVVSQRGTRSSQREDYVSRGAHRLRGIPTTILINGGSASASEIVAGALQDHKAATVIGTKSFGKGSVQEYDELPDGSALKLTIALWYTPNDKTINELGITPNIIIEDKKEPAAPGAPETLAPPAPRTNDWTKDIFIQRALQFLKTGK